MSAGDWIRLLVITSAGILLGMMFTVVSPILPLITGHFAAQNGNQNIGPWLLTAPSIGVVLAGFLIGEIIERLGARRTLLASTVFYAATGSAGLYLDDPMLLFASRMLLGAAGCGQVTAGTTLLGELFSGERLGRVLGLQGAFSSVMGVVGALASGALAQAGGWRMSFALYFAGLLTFAVGWLALPETPRPARLRAPWHLADFAPFSGVYLLIVFTFVLSFFSSAQIPLLLATNGFGQPTTISRIVAIAIVCFALGALCSRSIRARLGVRATIAAAIAAQAAGILVLAASEQLLPITAGSILLNFGCGIQMPNLSRIILERAPAQIRGRAIGFSLSAEFLGPFTNAFLLAPVMKDLGNAPH